MLLVVEFIVAKSSIIISLTLLILPELIIELPKPLTFITPPLFIIAVASLVKVLLMVTTPVLLFLKSPRLIISLL